MNDKVDILLVDDNANDLELTLDAFQENRLAARIEVARDGVAALDFLFCTGTYSDRQPDDLPKLVLLDLKLPKINGLEVVARIRADERTRCIPIIVLTSSAQERDVIESYRLGANSYIVKPVDFVQFTKAVQQLGCYWLLLNHPPQS